MTDPFAPPPGIFTDDMTGGQMLYAAIRHFTGLAKAEPNPAWWRVWRHIGDVADKHDLFDGLDMHDRKALAVAVALDELAHSPGALNAKADAIERREPMASYLHDPERVVEVLRAIDDALPR